MSSLTRNNYEGRSVKIGSKSITLGEELGAGTEGGVYRIEGDSSSVAKIFNEGYRDKKADKVQAMINNPPRDPTHDKSGVRSIIWPSDLVSDSSGSFIGYQMPYKSLNEVKHALHYSMVDLKWDNSSEQERFRTALNFAIMVHAVHKQDHAIGDFNHENVLIDDGVITLIDCDGFHISGKQATYKGETFFPRYSPPEKRETRLNKVRQADRFCLGVYIFQFLMEGNHPYLAQGPDAATGDWGEMVQNNPFPYDDTSSDVEPHDQAPDYYALPSEVREKFSSCFGASAKQVGYGRPSPKEWIKTLQETDIISTGISVGSPKSSSGGGDGSTGDGSTIESPYGTTGSGDSQPTGSGTSTGNGGSASGDSTGTDVQNPYGSNSHSETSANKVDSDESADGTDDDDDDTDGDDGFDYENPY